MEQLLPWLVFCTAVSMLCLFRPNAARIFTGIFFIIMAVGVNLVLSISAPEQFVQLGTAAPLIPLYDWAFEHVVARAPALVGILAAAGEITIGLLILSSGRRVKLGLLAAIVFLLVITPLGIWTLPNPVLAAGLAWLIRKDYPISLLQLIRAPRRPTHV
ncbi:hypothetical protein [Paenarthrobacter ureafaciens]|jgi:hypothetical protein|uniref:hypothetical protein n=1 Tax=Paenarthrobacter ureafaciens TaxID=37931 RepID=UPI001407A92C|nr:hypothetical protein [Paenarthrobacter ureafaciens]MCX8455981.1 hypothetical protein [Paenarthrobacter ureafaciens]MCY0975065.1 hypothetical protein [Paenarthrobacter ureafaciens]